LTHSPTECCVTNPRQTVYCLILIPSVWLTTTDVKGCSAEPFSYSFNVTDYAITDNYCCETQVLRHPTSLMGTVQPAGNIWRASYGTHVSWPRINCRHYLLCPITSWHV
jgi:hypothetical protein